MYFSTILATALAFTGTAIAAPPKPGPGKGPGGPGGPGKEDSLAKAMRARGRSFIGSAWTIRDNETAEFEIIKNDLSSSVCSLECLINY